MEDLQRYLAAVTEFLSGQLNAIFVAMGEAEDLGILAVRELPVLLLAILVAYLLFRRRRLRSASAIGVSDLRALTRYPHALGYGAAFIFFGGFGIWAATAVLASAVIAPGVVSPDGYRKTVQHLEGGIIRGIHVREGDVVKAGQVLLTMQALDAQGRYDELRERYVHNLAVEARLEAELANTVTIDFPEEMALLGGQQAKLTMAGQQELLQSQLATRQGRERILGQRIKQVEEEIGGLREIITSEDIQLALIQREIDGARQLYENGLERLPRLLALERQQAEIVSSKAASRAQIAQNEQEIGETEMELLTTRQQDREKVSQEITTVRAALAELRSQLPWREDILNRTSVVAPIAGTVMNLRVTTASGVIGGGQPILDIVPQETNLVIDARVRPVDIEMIRPEMKTRVVLSAYPQRHLPQIIGTLLSVSADRLVDDRTGDPFFLAKVEVDPMDLEAVKEIKLTPGMPVEVMILTGEHTLLDYLLAPLRDSIMKSFRES